MCCSHCRHGGRLEELEGAGGAVVINGNLMTKDEGFASIKT